MISFHTVFVICTCKGEHVKMHAVNSGVPHNYGNIRYMCTLVNGIKITCIHIHTHLHIIECITNMYTGIQVRYLEPTL